MAGSTPALQRLFQLARSLLLPYECTEPPDGGIRGSLVVLASFTIYIVSVGYQYATGVFFKAWVRSAEFSSVEPSSLAWANSLEAAGFLCGSVSGGWLMARSSPRTCALLGASFILAGTLVATGLAGASPAGLFALYSGFGALMGIGNSLTCLAAVCSVQQYFSRRRGTATGITVAGSGVGAFTLGPVLETLVDAFGWRAALSAYGVATASICVVCAAILVPIVISGPPGRASIGSSERQAGGTSARSGSNALPVSTSRRRLASLDAEAEVDLEDIGLHAAPSPARAGAAFSAKEAAAASQGSGDGTDRPRSASAARGGGQYAAEAGGTEGSTPASSSPAQPATPLPSYADLLDSPGLTTFCCFLAMNSVMWFIVPTFMPVYIVEDVGGSSNDVKGVVATQGAANMVGRVILGVAVDAVPRRKVQLLVMCAGAAATATLGLSLTTSLAYAYVAEAVIGGFGGSVMSLQPALIIDLVGIRALPLAQGVLGAVQAPSALLGSPLGGAVRAAWGSYQGTWLLAAAAHFVSTAFAFGVSRGCVDLRCCRRRFCSGGGGGGGGGGAAGSAGPALTGGGGAGAGKLSGGAVS